MEYSQSSTSAYEWLAMLFDDDRIRYGRQIKYPGFDDFRKYMLVIVFIAVSFLCLLAQAFSRYHSSAR